MPSLSCMYTRLLFNCDWAKEASSYLTSADLLQIRKGCCGIYDFTAHIFLILSLTCTSKSGRGRRRFARCSVDMGDCWRRGRV